MKKNYDEKAHGKMVVTQGGARFDKLQFVAAAATCDLASDYDKLKFVEP